MPRIDVMLRQAKLGKSNYSYCARDPAMAFALLFIFAWEKKRRYVWLSELRREFWGTIGGSYDIGNARIVPQRTLYMDADAWGPQGTPHGGCSTRNMYVLYI